MAKELPDETSEHVLKLSGRNEPDLQPDQGILVGDFGFFGGLLQLAEVAQLLHERVIASGGNLHDDYLWQMSVLFAIRRENRSVGLLHQGFDPGERRCGACRRFLLC